MPHLDQAQPLPGPHCLPGPWPASLRLPGLGPHILEPVCPVAFMSASQGGGDSVPTCSPRPVHSCCWWLAPCQCPRAWHLPILGDDNEACSWVTRGGLYVFAK